MARTITDRKLVNTASGGAGAVVSAGGAGAEDAGIGLPVMADGRVLTDVELYGDPKSSYANHVIFKTGGVWTVPEGVTSLRVTCMGGRGGNWENRVTISSAAASPGGGSASCLNITAGAGAVGLTERCGEGGVGSGGIINGRGGNGGNGGYLKTETINGNSQKTQIPAQPGNPGTNRAPAGGAGAPYKSPPSDILSGGGGGGYAMGYVAVTPGKSIAYTVDGFGNPYVMIEY